MPLSRIKCSGEKIHQHIIHIHEHTLLMYNALVSLIIVVSHLSENRA